MWVFSFFSPFCFYFPCIRKKKPLWTYTSEWFFFLLAPSNTSNTTHQYVLRHKSIHKAGVRALPLSSLSSRGSETIYFLLSAHRRFPEDQAGSHSCSRSMWGTSKPGVSTPQIRLRSNLCFQVLDSSTWWWSSTVFFCLADPSVPVFPFWKYKIRSGFDFPSLIKARQSCPYLLISISTTEGQQVPSEVPLWAEGDFGRKNKWSLSYTGGTKPPSDVHKYRGPCVKTTHCLAQEKMLSVSWELDKSWIPGWKISSASTGDFEGWRVNRQTRQSFALTKTCREVVPDTYEPPKLCPLL